MFKTLDYNIEHKYVKQHQIFHNFMNTKVINTTRIFVEFKT